ncbi:MULTISPECIES: 4a-hydroxytetrahydrobiopterin dehydratase [unclassified Spirillospora]|uniref:4a-hydroxytetrahydrobiopterin dehydratase n=1 Tax=unclassified Spirillospora TaxID=2642701 RepID=UPI003723B08C
MFAPPGAGGGVTGSAGQEAPLTPEEVDAALGPLPDWSGDTGELRRTLVLPSGNLDRVLRRIDPLREEMGRGPEVRRSADGIQLAMRTVSADAVTALDVELASRLDDAIDEAGAQMGS